MAEVNTPEVASHSSIVVPDGTPEPIRRALDVAASCQFCTFLSPLEVTAEGEFAIEARIGPASEMVDAPVDGPVDWYRVRFLIPRAFPFATVHTVPLEPPLTWHPHQNGDWPREVDPHANVLCPANLNEIHADELLLSHIRHAYAWITDALRGALIRPDERYEFPHLIRRSRTCPIVYVEGGSEMLGWLRQVKCGRAWLRRVKDRGGPAGLFRVEELRPIGEQDDTRVWRSQIGDAAFGDEEVAGWAPWVLVGSPVAQPPHRPPVQWEDFPEYVQRRIVQAARDVARYKRHVPVLLLAFAVPERWCGGPERAVWAAVELDRVDPNDFQPPNGFRPNSDPLRWPPVNRFVARHNPLPWIGICTDISPEALASRRGSSPPHTPLADQSASSQEQAIRRLAGDMPEHQPHRELAPLCSSSGEPGHRGEISDLRVGVVGVGALGSMLAKALAKLDPRELLLLDKDALEPGNLVRHEALPFQVTKDKASALAVLLQPLSSDRQVRGLRKDVVQAWDEVAPQLAACDLIIDATADSGVHGRLLAGELLAGIPVVWCYVKPGPDFGVIVLRRSGSALTIEEAEAALRSGVDAALWERFVGSERREGSLVWPEPGCYFPTFNAPYHRLRMLADAFLTILESWVRNGCPADVVTLVQQEEPTGRYGIEQRIAAQISSPYAGIETGVQAQEGQGRGLK